LALSGRSAACAPPTASKTAADPIIVVFVVLIFISTPSPPERLAEVANPVRPDVTGRMSLRREHGKHKPAPHPSGTQFFGRLLHNGNAPALPRSKPFCPATS
jgi:hypothetical protein